MVMASAIVGGESKLMVAPSWGSVIMEVDSSVIVKQLCPCHSIWSMSCVCSWQFLCFIGRSYVRFI